jgi:hypothetical protein
MGNRFYFLTLVFFVLLLGYLSYQIEWMEIGMVTVTIIFAVEIDKWIRRRLIKSRRIPYYFGSLSP